MNTESSRMRQAVAKVSEELLAMSLEEFRAQLNAHKSGDVALALQEIWSMAQGNSGHAVALEQPLSLD